MSGAHRWSPARLAELVREQLGLGAEVVVEGLGRFRRCGRGRFELIPEARRKVFLAYAAEDRAAAERLYRDLESRGFDPWMDARKLLAGQNWPRAIERAIDVSDFVVLCMSRRGVSKRGTFQAELRYALECARRVPLGETYLLPARLDDCRPPERLAREVQWVDLFPDWDRGVARLAAAMRATSTRRAVSSGRGSDGRPARPRGTSRRRRAPSPSTRRASRRPSPL